MSKKIKTDDGNVEFEVCHLGVNVTDHHEQEAIWARLSDAQRVELAAALDPGRRGLLVRLDNQAATLATLQRERDEALRKKGEMVDRAVRAERERDAAVARAEQTEREVSTWRTSTESAHSDFLQAAHDRDEWKARAEQAENARDTAATRAAQLEKKLAKVMSDYQDLEDEREEIADQFATFRAEIVAEAVKSRESAVTRADIEKVVRRYIPNPHFSEPIADEVCALLSGSDPAVHVVRESDIEAVKVERRGGKWVADGEAVASVGDDPARVRRPIAPYLEWAVMAEAVSRAIEAEQAVDPVEAKARELYEVGNPGTVGMWESIHEAFKDGYRRIARHVLGLEADQ